MDPDSRAAKKNTSHENGMLPQDTTYLIQRPCCKRGSLCQDPDCLDVHRVTDSANFLAQSVENEALEVAHWLHTARSEQC